MDTICNVRFPMFVIDCICDTLSDEINSGQLINFPEGSEVVNWKGVTSVLAESYINTSLNRRILEAVNANFTTDSYAIKFDKLEPRCKERSWKCYEFNLWVNASNNFLECLGELHKKNKWHMFEDMTRGCPENFSEQNFRRDFAKAMETASITSKGEIKFLDAVWDASFNLLFGREIDELVYANAVLKRITEDNASALTSYIETPRLEDERMFDRKLRSRFYGGY